MIEELNAEVAEASAGSDATMTEGPSDESLPVRGGAECARAPYLGRALPLLPRRFALALRRLSSVYLSRLFSQFMIRNKQTSFRPCGDIAKYSNQA